MASNDSIILKQRLEDEKNAVGFQEISSHDSAIVEWLNTKNNEVFFEYNEARVKHSQISNGISTSAPQNKSRWKKRHLRRFWRRYLVAGIICLAIFFPLL